MSIEVLRIETAGYDISVNTNEIRSAWNRFKKRTHEEALHYCDYKCSNDGTLKVLNADSGRLEVAWRMGGTTPSSVRDTNLSIHYRIRESLRY